ncbi:transmembrane channel-like protein 5 isoform X2 [Eublepharis macularius]|uniref:Transmembrane channel-like protein n=1 Tax=Eublepharis macularius TaxID=481883 RepID=A0AA97K2L4_EUBMA|nr:transmembrane channel-like protein 5 isoform X2 [Eublepharis macularius]
MAFHYNDAFENPDYHDSETLELDRVPRWSASFHRNPYDSSPYDPYDDYSAEEQNSPMEMPVDSVQLQSPAEYSPRAFAFETSDSNPYGNAHINPSFDYEPEFAYMLPTSSDTFNDHYVHRPDTPDGVSIIQRRSRQEVDMAVLAPSSLLQLDPGYNEEKQKQEEKLIQNLANLSTWERIKAIKKIPKTMKEKREIRNHVLREKTKSHNQDAQINRCTQCFYNTFLSFRRFKNGLLECFQFFQLWQKTLKVIGGKFGTSVCSYFVFLTWLLMFNVFSFLVNFSFITVPQLIEAKADNLSFTGLEFFTGAGYFKETVLYYGFYTNGTISKTKSTSPYDMQLAYIFTIGIYFILCFLSLLYSMAKSFRRNFINPSMYSGHAAKLLCIWDFSITNEKAVKLKQRNLSTQMKETLSEVNTEVLKLSVCQKIAQLSIHLAAWVVSLGAAAASCAGIYYFSTANLELFLKDDKTELESEAVTLVLPIVVGLLNHMVPFFYSFFGFVEKFTYPKYQIYTSIGRNIILKMSIIGILCYYWLNIVAASKAQCWETLVGQDIYKLIVVEFICCLLGSFFGEFVRRIIGTKCCQQLGVPEFDIARNVLDLIYAQTLAWIGIFFSPLIPAIQIISFFIIFYVKKVSLMMNCQPPRKAWRASQMNTVFIFLLFFPSFTGVLSVIAVIVWRMKPSEMCGPFRGLETIFAAISSWVAILATYPASLWVVWIYHNLFESVHFFFILSVIVLIITYLYWQIIDGRKIMVRLLQEQIINEGKDKMFLLKKLRALQASRLPNTGQQQERNSSVPQLPRQQMLPSSPDDMERSPGIMERDSYVEPSEMPEMNSFSPHPAEIPGMTSFFPQAEMTSFSRAVQRDPQPAGTAGISDALALALRARQEAEWEMGEEDFRS